MDELRESSLLFSLESLLETERERVQREAREAQRRQEEELLRVAEAAERRRIAARQEREARERRQALEQERERLEQERLEALKRSAVERARIETEAQTRLIEADQARKHELSLAKLRERQRAGRYRAFAWLASAAWAASIALACAGYWGWIEPAQARREQHLQSILSTDAEQAKTAERALATERSKVQTLSQQLEQLQQAAATAARNLSGTPQGVTSRHSSAPPGRTPLRRELCPDDGDPLRSCLRGGH